MLSWIKSKIILLKTHACLMSIHRIGKTKVILLIMTIDTTYLLRCRNCLPFQSTRDHHTFGNLCCLCLFIIYCVVFFCHVYFIFVNCIIYRLKRKPDKPKYMYVNWRKVKPSHMQRCMSSYRQAVLPWLTLWLFLASFLYTYD